MSDETPGRTEGQRLFWNQYLQRYAGMESLTTPDKRRTQGRFAFKTVATLLNHSSLAALRDQTVMDFGCGTGRLARFFAPLCRRLICVDVSDDMLNDARRALAAYRNVDFVQGGGSDLERVGRVDFTYSYAALIYFSTADEFWQTVEAIDRTSSSFCLHLHRVVNERPNPGKGLEQVKRGEIYEVEAYRPRAATLKQRYPGAQYFVERHRPDVRGRDPFFFKSTTPRGGLKGRGRRMLQRLRVRWSLAASALP